MIVYDANGKRAVAPSDMDRKTARRLRRAHTAPMGGQKIGPRPVTASTQVCVVVGCAERPAKDTIICARHAEALRRGNP